MTLRRVARSDKCACECACFCSADCARAGAAEHAAMCKLVRGSVVTVETESVQLMG
jgi:hypothetical protein